MEILFCACFGRRAAAARHRVALRAAPEAALEQRVSTARTKPTPAAGKHSNRDKAHRWLDRMAGIAESNEQFRLCFLVGAPQEEELRSACESALSILGKASVDERIFAEQEADKLSGMLADEVARHQIDAVAEPPPVDR